MYISFGKERKTAPQIDAFDFLMELKLRIYFIQTQTQTQRLIHVQTFGIVSSGEMLDLIFPDHVIANIPYLQEIGNVSMRISRLLIVYQILAHGNDVTLTLHHFH